MDACSPTKNHRKKRSILGSDSNWFYWVFTPTDEKCFSFSASSYSVVKSAKKLTLEVQLSQRMPRFACHSWVSNNLKSRNLGGMKCDSFVIHSLFSLRCLLRLLLSVKQFHSFCLVYKLFLFWCGTNRLNFVLQVTGCFMPGLTILFLSGTNRLNFILQVTRCFT